MKYKHVIWDFDGTLFDTYPAISSAFQIALAENGVTEPYENIMALMKISISTCIEHYKKVYNIQEETLLRYKTFKTELEEKTAKPFSGIEDICKAVCQSGGKNYVYTHRGASTAHFIEKFQMSQYFVELVTSDNNFPSKPKPDAILYLIQKYGMKPDDAIMVGDREIDILSAKNAGIFSCCFTVGGKACDAADFNADTVDMLFNTLVSAM